VGFSQSQCAVHCSRQQIGDRRRRSSPRQCGGVSSRVPCGFRLPGLGGNREYCASGPGDYFGARAQFESRPMLHWRGSWALRLGCAASATPGVGGWVGGWMMMMMMAGRGGGVGDRLQSARVVCVFLSSCSVLFLFLALLFLPIL
jgi:hypothetical protein